MAYCNVGAMYKRWLRAFDVGDKNSMGDNATTREVVTVGVEKCDNKNKVI